MPVIAPIWKSFSQKETEWQFVLIAQSMNTIPKEVENERKQVSATSSLN